MAWKRWGILVFLFMLMGCTPGGIKQAGLHSSSDDQQLYQQGRELMEAEDYPQAAVRLLALLRQYPLSPLRQDTQLALAFSQLQLGQSREAFELAREVIKNSNDSQHLAYAYYLRANARLAVSPAPSAQQVEKATLDLTQVTDRLGENIYRSAAKELRNKLYHASAAREFMAAKQSFRRQEPVTVLNRCRYLIEHYPQSDEVVKALALMVDAYRQLGLDDLASSTDAILQQRKALSSATSNRF